MQYTHVNLLKNEASIPMLHFNLYRLVRAVYTGPSSYRYADRPLLGGTTKNQSSAVDFDRQRPIKGEIDRRRLIEGEKGKKKKKKKKKKKRKRRKKRRRGETGKKKIPRAVLARRSLSRRRCRHPLFLLREETEHLPSRGKRSRR
ncbi:hypothetical protein B296_00055169, partial [Ensete ventricosum]